MNLYYTIFSLLLISCIFETASTKTKHKVLILWGVFFTLFGGLRWQIGGDWEQYHDHFLHAEWDNIFNYDRYGNGVETLEPFFVFLNVLVKSIFGSFYWYNIIVCAFIQFTYIHASKYYYKEHPIMMYTFIMLMGGNYFPVRAGLCIAICYWAYQMIKERNLKIYLLIMLVAFNIHHASLALLPAYWFGHIRLKSIYLFGIFGLMLVLGAMFQDYFSLIAVLMGGDLGEKALAYTENQTEGFDVRGSYMIGNVIAFFLLFMYIRLRRSVIFDTYWINTLLNCFVVYYSILFVFREGMGDLTRLSSYFFVANAILFMYTLKELKVTKRLFYIVGMCFFTLYMGYQITKACDGYFFEMSNVPYKTIFDYQNVK